MKVSGAFSLGRVPHGSLSGPELTLEGQASDPLIVFASP